MNTPSEREAKRMQIRDRIAEVIEGSVDDELLDFVAEDDASRDLVYEAERLVDWVQGAASDHVFSANQIEEELSGRIDALDAEVAASAAGALEPEAPTSGVAARGEPARSSTPAPQNARVETSSGSALATGRSPGRVLAAVGVVLALVALVGIALRRPAVTGPRWEGLVSEISLESGLELCGAAGVCRPASIDARVEPGATLRTDARTRARLELTDGTVVSLDASTEFVLDAGAPRRGRLNRGRIVADVIRRGDAAPATFDVPLGYARVLGTKLALTVERDFVLVEVSRGAVELVDRRDRAVTVYAGERGRLSEGEPPTATNAPSLGDAFGWSESAFEPDDSDAAFAPGLGELVAKKPGEDTERTHAVSLSRHSVKVRISGPIARTEIEEVFTNSTDEVLEGIYRFPLPPDAHIERLALDVDGKMVEGAFVERDKAAAIWRGAIVHSSDKKRPIQEEIVWVPGPWKDPALLEWQRGGRFELRIFPIPRRGMRRISLAYTQTLAPSGATRRYVYPLPADPGGSTRVARFEFDARIRGLDPRAGVRAHGHEFATALERDAGTATFSASDFSPAGDLWLEYRLAGADRELTAFAYRTSGDTASVGDTPSADDPGGEAYAALALRPDLPRIGAREPQSIAVVVDASRSMIGERYRRAVKLVERLVRELDPTDQVTALACDVECREIAGGPRAPGSDAAREVAEFYGAIVPEGGSDLAAAVRFAVDAAKVDSSRGTHVIYVGDGTPTVGPTDPAFLYRDVAGSVPSDVRVTAVALGVDSDLRALEAVASAGGGPVLNYAPGRRSADMVYAVLGATYGATLRNVRVALPDGLEDVVPSRVPTLVAGGEVYVLAKMKRPAVSGTVQLRGEVGGRPFERSYPLDLEAGTHPGNAFVPRLYAARKIQELEHDPRAESRERVVALSKRFSVASRYTSLLVLESEAMFRAFGLDNQRQAAVWSGEEDLESDDSGAELEFAPADFDVPAGRPLRASELGRAELASGSGQGARSRAPALAKKPKASVARRAAPPSTGWPGARPEPFDMAPSDPFVPPEEPVLEMPPPRPRRMIPMRKVWERTGRFIAGRSVPGAASGDAIAKAERDVEANPLRREPLKALYVLYMLADRIDEAGRLAERWSEKDPLDPEALTARADVAAARGDRQLAIRILGSVVDVRPGDHKAQWRLARLHRWAGRPKMGCRHSMAVAQIRPGDSKLLVEALRCARRVGEARLAEDLLSAADPETRRETERLLRAGSADPDRVRGDLQVSAQWDGGVDLDLALWHPQGHRVSWLGAPTRSIITASDVQNPAREALALRGAMPGEYVVEVSRVSGGSQRASGTIEVQVAGIKNSVPFVLTGERMRVGIAKIGMRSRLVPL